METQRIYAVGRASLFRSQFSRGQWRHDWVKDLVQRLRWVSHKPWLPRWIKDQAALAAFRLRPLTGGTASNAFETDILELIFNATALADLAQDDASAPATTIATALHTGDPGEAGNQATSEADYASYARETPARTAGGFSVSGPAVTPVANIEFTTSTGAGTTITHFSYGSGVGNYMICSGAISPTIPVGAAGVTPILTTATSVTCD